ncbi:MAG: DUF503 domain-containing protein [Acidimicrobiia bacterium]|nr:DUF503 domain-containing protein [Acidimicrobiia bacterium]
MSLHAAAALLELHVPDAQSLKEKRGVLVPLIASIRATFPVAVAEVDHQNTWQRSTVAVGFVAADAPTLESLIAAAVDHVDRSLEVDLVHTAVSYLEDPTS